MPSIEEKIKRHKDFWDNQIVDRPLMEFVIGGWSVYRTNPAHVVLCNMPTLQVSDIHPADFVPWVEQYLNDMACLDDDAIRPGQPHQAIPWLEAAIGCNIRSGEDHIWSEPFLQEPDSSRLPESIAESPWTKKYLEFLNVYGNHFGSEIPLAQSILRGPLDLACAAMGEEQCIYALTDTPKAMEHFLQRITSLTIEFFRLQWEHIPCFHDGMVIGQYDLWASGPALRFQEDASALLSPKLYTPFVRSCDESVCALTPYNVFHLHSTSLHLLPQILEIPNLRAIQLSVDEGVPLEEILPGSKAIQNVQKRLIIRGQFHQKDFIRIGQSLVPNGLCIQVVVKERNEMNSLPDGMMWSTCAGGGDS